MDDDDIFALGHGGPDKAMAKAVLARCGEERLILLTCGTHGNVIGWILLLIGDDSPCTRRWITSPGL